jgi:hypothetical protein
MENAVNERTPMHLWIVGGLATLWNAFGGYDYTMTRMGNLEYLSQFGADGNAILAWIDSFPMWAQFGWGLGVWMALLGSILLLLRSRWAVPALGLSLVGMVLSFGYQYGAAPPMPGTAGQGAMAYMPLVIAVIGVALFLYARAMAAKGVLR